MRGGLVLLTVLLAGCGPPETDLRDDRSSSLPPVVLVSIDTLRADHLSAYGYHRPTSPRIEALAARGVLFRQAFSQAPCTAPSHMSLMTSLYPEAHGVKQWRATPGANRRLHESIPTLASLLADAGYRTEAYTAGGNIRPDLGFDAGFDVYESHGRYVERIFDRGLAALERLAADPEGRPFLLFLHTLEVHDPYLPPARLADRFTQPSYGGLIPSSDEVLESWPHYRSEERTRVFWHLVDEGNPEDVERLQALYDACILHIDEQVGRVLDRLDALGLGDDALVIFTADHGEEFLDHGAFRHDSQYQELLHVPLVMKLPGATAGEPGRVVDQVVRHIDVLPTVLELLGLPSPAHLQGRSLLPLLRESGSGPGSDEPLVFSQWPRADYHALRHGNWKLIRKNPVRENPIALEALFDLAADPDEQHDLAYEHPDVVRRLRDEMDRLRALSRDLLDGFGRGPAVEMDAETRKQLEGLGYLGR